MKTRLKWVPFLAAALTLVGLFIFSSYTPAISAPAMQLTPAVDPMSTPTVVAPALDTQNGLPGNTTDTDVDSDQMNCPMMSGSMGTGSMTGMTGMTGMSGMGAMSGSMSGSMPGSMVMGAMDMDDALSNAQGGLFFTTNPWWLVGWIVVFIILIGVLVLLVLGIIWMVKRIRGEKTAVSG